MIAWQIDTDHLAESGDSVFLSDEYNCKGYALETSGGYTIERMPENSEIPDAVEFRLYDGDNILYYEGRVNEDYAEEMYDYWQIDSGCTRLDLKNADGDWIHTI